MSMYNKENSFVVGLDPGYILMCMEMWQKTLDMKIPIHDNLKVHFMANRRNMLEGFEKTAHAWDMMLGASTLQAGEGHEARLDELRAKVEEFKEWAKAGLAELAQAAEDDAVDDAMEDAFLELRRNPAEMQRLYGESQKLQGGPKKGNES